MTDAEEVYNLVVAVIEDLRQTTIYSGLSRGLADNSAQHLLVSIEKLKDSRPHIQAQIELVEATLAKLSQLFYSRVSDHVREAMAQLEKSKKFLKEYYERSQYMIEELEKRYNILHDARIGHELEYSDTATLEAIDQITAYIERL